MNVWSKSVSRAVTLEIGVGAAVSKLRRFALPALLAFGPLAFAAGDPNPPLTMGSNQSRACNDVVGLAPAGVRITSATAIDAQPGWSPTPQGRRVNVAAPFCRVQGVIDTEIGFELWLPDAANWNGKMLGAGVGGDAGTFNFTDLPRAVARGYAAATTDTGHKASEANWMLGDPMRLVNFEHRAHHRLAEVAKGLIAAHYGRGATRAYFIGCSGGGRQGLKEMQKYPADYDGIIAGAAGPKTPEMTVRRMWELLRRDANPGVMTPADWRLVADEATRTCDARDGVTDGVAEDPRACSFRVDALRCKDDRTSTCLSDAQVTFAQSFYEPLLDANGRALDRGLLPGVLVDSGRSRLAPATFGQAVRKIAEWNGQDFDVTRDLAAIDRVMPDLRADSVDLAAFKARSGKAIFYQGWMDPAVPASMAVDYQQQLEAAMGGRSETASFARLFMVPGMLHCSGGSGTDQFGGSGADAPTVDPNHDLLSALEAWVERGQAPDRIIASRMTNGTVTRTRPLCVFPSFAKYNGSGDPNSAASFTCVQPER